MCGGCSFNPYQLCARTYFCRVYSLGLIPRCSFACGAGLCRHFWTFRSQFLHPLWNLCLLPEIMSLAYCSFTHMCRIKVFLLRSEATKPNIPLNTAVLLQTRGLSVFIACRKHAIPHKLHRKFQEATLRRLMEFVFNIYVQRWSSHWNCRFFMYFQHTAKANFVTLHVASLYF